MGRLAVGLAVAVAVLPLSAQQPPPAVPAQSSGLVKKGRAPVSSTVLKVKLPTPEEADTANGLHLIVLTDHRLPRVSFQVIVPGAGGYYDPDGKVGLAAYTAQMMREGTATRTSQQMSQDLETLAAQVTVVSGLSATSATVSGGSLTDDLPRVFEIASDVLQHPSFPPDEWERLKTRTKAGLQQQRTQPGFLSAEMFNRVVYGSHPASRVGSTPQALDAISRDDMVAFHRGHFVPDHAAVAFAGDITLADARKLVEATLGGWKKSGAPAADGYESGRRRPRRRCTSSRGRHPFRRRSWLARSR